ncbi:uncharacterized protein LOC142994698 [Genypterus blacodes]|uniref:uncharacterized protein LOC142994698 n=1 Tax=Genypterus blacodes TaxID=154954 RepID=UPI003F761171
MAGKAMILCALMAALLLSCSASPPGFSSSGDAKESEMLQRLLARREKAGDDTKEQAAQTRMQRRAHLSVDEREIMTKQIMQAISEMMNSECMSDRDYQGWVDFGRRSAE